MPEEWLTYREISARLGLNVEAVRTRVRRAGWRTQPGNDGRTRVLVPDRAVLEPVRHDDDGVNEGVNNGRELTGLVALLTAAEARIGRLEERLEAERDRLNEAQTKIDRLRDEVVEQTARAVRAEQASTAAEARADAAETGHQVAVQAVEEQQRAEEVRKARGRWDRLKAAWKGE